MSGPPPRGLGFVGRILYNMGRGRHQEKHQRVVGTDHLGNTYWEIPADPSRGIRKPKRGFEGKDYVAEDSGTVELPMEWQAWLRMRRDDPPTPEEVFRNMQLAEIKKQKGDAANRALSSQPDAPSRSFDEKYPRYEELEKRSNRFERVQKAMDDKHKDKKEET